MGIDGIFNDRPAQADQRTPIGDPRQDPRFASGRGDTASSGAAHGAAAAGAKTPLGDDRLQLSPEAPDNPFQALINSRQRKRRRKRDGDPTSLD
ncbi:MAG TPA: hypothetical protein V6D05_04335 [Stenomitos sp.]